MINNNIVFITKSFNYSIINFSQVIFFFNTLNYTKQNFEVLKNLFLIYKKKIYYL